MVKQMNGEYRVKNPDLLGCTRRRSDSRPEFESVTITHVRREQNKRADEIGNDALDGKPASGRDEPPGPLPDAECRLRNRESQPRGSASSRHRCHRPRRRDSHPPLGGAGLGRPRARRGAGRGRVGAALVGARRGGVLKKKKAK